MGYALACLLARPAPPPTDSRSCRCTVHLSVLIVVKQGHVAVRAQVLPRAPDGRSRGSSWRRGARVGCIVLRQWYGRAADNRPPTTCAALHVGRRVRELRLVRLGMELHSAPPPLPRMWSAMLLLLFTQDGPSRDPCQPRWPRTCGHGGAQSRACVRCVLPLPVFLNVHGAAGPEGVTNAQFGKLQCKGGTCGVSFQSVYLDLYATPGGVNELRGETPLQGDDSSHGAATPRSEVSTSEDARAELLGSAAAADDGGASGGGSGGVANILDVGRQAQQTLLANRERLEDLAETTAEMSRNADDFHQMARKLAEQERSRGWFR
jgi:hypothetical protein